VSGATEAAARPVVVDADTHLTEVHDLWTSRAPPEIKERVPKVVDQDGIPTWVVDGSVLARATGGGVVAIDGSKGPPAEACLEWPIEAMHAAAYDPVARLELMDDQGIAVQVVFPNTVGFGGDILSNTVNDPELRLACLQLYNDFGAELQRDTKERLLSMAVLPAWDVGASVRETLRGHDMGLRGVNMTMDPQDQGGPDLASPDWDPLWEVVSDLALPVHFHIGASATTMAFFGDFAWPSQDRDVAVAVGSALLFQNNARVVSNICCSGLLDRFPALQFVSVESGAGWVPFALLAIDFEMQENAPERLAELSMMPSAYVKRNFTMTFWFEPLTPGGFGHWIGEDNLMFATDFPHPTCLFPDPVEVAMANTAALSPEGRAKVLGGNAARLYRLDLPTID